MRCNYSQRLRGGWRDWSHLIPGGDITNLLGMKIIMGTRATLFDQQMEVRWSTASKSAPYLPRERLSLSPLMNNGQLGMCTS